MRNTWMRDFNADFSRPVPLFARIFEGLIVCKIRRAAFTALLARLSLTLVAAPSSAATSTTLTARTTLSAAAGTVASPLTTSG